MFKNIDTYKLAKALPWIVTIVVMFVILWVLFAFPNYFWLSLFVAIALVSSTWNRHLIEPRYQWHLDYADDAPLPKGFRTLVVRFRLALFSSAASVATFILLAQTLHSIGSSWFMKLFVGYWLIFLGALFNRYMALAAMFVWRYAYEMVFDTIEILIYLFTKDEPRRAAFQRLYNFENWLFSKISGYQTSAYFRADTEILKEKLPYA